MGFSSHHRKEKKGGLFSLWNCSPQGGYMFFFFFFCTTAGGHGNNDDDDDSKNDYRKNTFRVGKKNLTKIAGKN